MADAWRSPEEDVTRCRCGRELQGLAEALEHEQAAHMAVEAGAVLPDAARAQGPASPQVRGRRPPGSEEAPKEARRGQ